MEQLHPKVTRIDVVGSLLLAVPFVFMVLLFAGLTKQVPTFHGEDELTYHYPVILEFATQFPRPDFSDYQSATTPLFHVAFATVGKVIGFELYKLRLLNTAVSFLAVLALYRFLRRRFDSTTSLLFATAFALSPYFFGASFILLTDNLAILFVASALLALERFREQPTLGSFSIACCATAFAVLTRQIHMWLAILAAYYLLTTSIPVRRKWAGAALLALSLAPLAYFVLLWGGITPPSFRNYQQFGMANLRSVGFAVALIGLYALFLCPRQVADVLRHRGFIVAVGIGLLCVAVVPLAYQPDSAFVDDGFLWRVSSWLPNVGARGVLFWLLVPAGVAAIYGYARRPRFDALPLVYLSAFLAVCLTNAIVFQKYYDPFVLLGVMLLHEPGASSPAERVGTGALLAGFAAYALYHFLRSA